MLKYDKDINKEISTMQTSKMNNIVGDKLDLPVFRENMPRNTERSFSDYLAIVASLYSALSDEQKERIRERKHREPPAPVPFVWKD
jgi:hypothetical protein